MQLDYFIIHAFWFLYGKLAIINRYVRAWRDKLIVYSKMRKYSIEFKL